MQSIKFAIEQADNMKETMHTVYANQTKFNKGKAT